MSDINYKYTLSSSSDIDFNTPNDKEVLKNINDVEQKQEDLFKQQGEFILKALQSDNPDLIIKGYDSLSKFNERYNNQMKSKLIDPNNWQVSSGYKNKMQYSDVFKRRLAKAPIIKAIISTRQDQVSAFAIPQSKKYENGFVIKKRKKDYYSDKEVKMSLADKQKAIWLTDFILNCGHYDNKWHGDTFETFLSKIVKDSLELDAATWENVENRRGELTEFVSVDASTIYFADSYDDNYYESIKQHSNIERKKVNGYYPSYCQVIDEEIIADFYPWELCYGIRNAVTDIKRNGYGHSEIESLVSIITWQLYSDVYNGKFFSQGSSPKGLLKVSPNVNRNRLLEFRQQFLSMVSGVQNAWKIPIIESDKMEWIDLQKSNTDMQFENWQEYLIKIACAVFKISPDEVGFKFKSSNLSDGGDEARLKYSIEKGLRPLLKKIEFWINKFIIWRIDDNFEFKFVGYDIMGEEKELELLNKKVEHGMGYKEYREAIGLPKELEEGDFPLNSAFIQMYNAMQFQGQQEESTGFVDDGEEDNSLWDSLDENEEVQKSFNDNPMMQDAMETFNKYISE